MSFIKKYLEQETINRRNLLLASAYGLGGAAAAGLMGPGMARAAIADPTIAWSYRNRTNPYWNEIVSGGEAFIESLGKFKDALTHLINEGSSEKSLADVKALLAKTNGDLALAIDTNDAPNARPVVEACVEAGAYVSTLWNKTDDLHPWDFGDNYVSHMSWSDEKPAEQTARILIEAMGGKGGVVHLGGIASNNPAIERLQGLKNALADYPDVELLDSQPADWDTQKANQIMSSFITRYGDEITGVHCANDTIGYGVLEALRAEGMEVPIVTYDGNPAGGRADRRGQDPGDRVHQPPLGRRHHRIARLSCGDGCFQAVGGAERASRVLRADHHGHAGRRAAVQGGLSGQRADLRLDRLLGPVERPDHVQVMRWRGRVFRPRRSLAFPPVQQRNAQSSIDDTRKRARNLAAYRQSRTMTVGIK